MIPGLIAKATEVALLPPAANWHFNAHIRWNRVLVDLFGPDHERFHLRVAETYSLDEEFETVRYASAALGRSVPEPLGMIKVGAVDAIVFESVQGRFIPAAQLLRAGRSSSEVSSLLSLFESMARKFATDVAPEEPDRWVTAIESRFDGTDEAELVRAVLRRLGRDGRSSRPTYWQHGDLVVDNLVFRMDGAVLFDWEDFRKVSLAGFDLTTLLASVAGFDATCLQAIRSANGSSRSGNPASWLPDACRVVGLEPEEFWALAPFHLLVFLALKDRYSPSIRRRVLAAVQGLA